MELYLPCPFNCPGGWFLGRSWALLRNKSFRLKYSWFCWHIEIYTCYVNLFMGRWWNRSECPSQLDKVKLVSHMRECIKDVFSWENWGTHCLLKRTLLKSDQMFSRWRSMTVPLDGESKLISPNNACLKWPGSWDHCWFKNVSEERSGILFHSDKQCGRAFIERNIFWNYDECRWYIWVNSNIALVMQQWITDWSH
jgi:hypothetical protein